MDRVSRKDFAEAVVAAISSVQHLYREVDRLISALRDALSQDPDALGVVRGTLARSGTGRDAGRVVARNEYALLFEPIVEEDEFEGDDKMDSEDEDDADDADDRVVARGRKQRPVEIDPDQPFLALRVVLVEAKSAEEFEPFLQYAVLGDWGLGAAGSKPKAGQPLTVRRHMMRRIPRVLGSKADFAKRMLTNARVIRKGITGVGDWRLSCRVLGGVRSVPLYDLDDAAALDQLALTIKDYWTQTQMPRGSS